MMMLTLLSLWYFDGLVMLGCSLYRSSLNKDLRHFITLTSINRFWFNWLGLILLLLLQTVPLTYDGKLLLKETTNLIHPRDGTKTALGIATMRELFKTGGRAGVPWVCIVITDGISKDPPKTKQEALLAKEMGTCFLAFVNHSFMLIIRLLLFLSSYYFCFDNPHVSDNKRGYTMGLDARVKQDIAFSESGYI